MTRKKNIEEEEVIIEKILDKKIERGITKYKVKLKGVSEDEATWECLDDFLGNMQIIEEFEAQRERENKKKPKRENLLLLKRKRSDVEEPQVKTRSKYKRENIEQENDSNDNESSNSSESEEVDINEEKIKENDFGVIGLDSPIEIIGIKANTNDEKDLICEVKWKKRKTQKNPKNSFYPFNIIKKIHPTLLVDFLEKHMVFPKRKGKK